MIITRLTGGMGNQMFQYAFGRALAIKHNTTLGLDITSLTDTSRRIKKTTPRTYSLDVLNIHGDIIAPSNIPLLYRPFTGNIGLGLDFFRRKLIRLPGVEKCLTFDPSMMNIGPTAYLNGVWQSEQYFKDYEDVIRKDFSLKNPLSPAAVQLHEKIQTTETVSLHVRRGDYVYRKDAAYILGLCPLSYYENAVAYIQSKATNPVFYIFSDDIEWCRENLPVSAETIFVSGLKEHEDLYLMSKCTHHIIANSTFSWWGSWLDPNPDKIVIAPKKWYNDTSFSTESLIPKEWITL